LKTGERGHVPRVDILFQLDRSVLERTLSGRQGISEVPKSSSATQSCLLGLSALQTLENSDGVEYILTQDIDL